MKNVGAKSFEKVEYLQFLKDELGKDIIEDLLLTDSGKEDLEFIKGELTHSYDDMITPQRATNDSAGYDFYSVVDYNDIPKNAIVKVNTGWKLDIDSDKYLQLSIRSSMAFNNRWVLVNQLGNIDSDYYNNKSNEGHIIFGLRNISGKVLSIKVGERIGQGIILPYYIVYGDKPVTSKRIGGLGSSGK